MVPTSWPQPDPVHPGTGPPGRTSKGQARTKATPCAVLENMCPFRKSKLTWTQTVAHRQDAWATKGRVLGRRGAAAAGGQLRGRGGARGRYGRSAAGDPVLAVEHGPGPTPVAGEWSPDAVRPPALHVHVRAARAHAAAQAALACAYCCGWRSDRDAGPRCAERCRLAPPSRIPKLRPVFSLCTCESVPTRFRCICAHVRARGHADGSV
jgi:hypothetical protein